MQKVSMNLIFTALIILCLGIFTSISISAIAHILLALSIGLYIAHDPKNYLKKLTLKKHLIYSLIAFIAAIIISVLGNWSDIDGPLKNLLKVKYFLLPLLSVPVLNEFFKNHFNKKKLKILVYLFIISTTVATLSGLIGVYTGFNPLKFKPACHEFRACGLYGMYMTYGYGISLFMVLMTGSLVYLKDFKRFVPAYLFVPIWLINFIGLFTSYARGGILSFLISIPFYALKKLSKKIVLCFLAIFIVLGSIVALTPSLNDKMFKWRGVSNMQRLAFYETSLKAFSERPILGWGYKNYEPNVKLLKKKYDIAYPEYGADAHNIFLEVLASTGIVGLFAFLYFFFAWLKEAFSHNSLLHNLSFPFVISLGVSGMVQNIFGDGENLFLIMLMWSILAAYPKEMNLKGGAND